jgi:protein phosphatase PTC2/3
MSSQTLSSESTKESAALSLEDDQDHHKSQTFRKRRLSLPMHNLSPSKKPSLESFTTSEGDTENLGKTSCGKDKTVANPDLLFDEDLKSKTFRDRRLSLAQTSVNSTDSFDAPDQTNHDDNFGITDFQDIPSNNTCDFEISLKDESSSTFGSGANRSKRRRLSDVSHDTTSTTGSMSRVYHAGELMAPASPTTRHKLYEGPHNLEQYRSESKQPLWKRRRTRRNSNDKKRLLFPSDVVGLYSCHGIEPVYQLDYSTGDDDDDDDDSEAEEKDEEEDSSSEEEMNKVVLRKQPRLTLSAKINQDRGGVAFPYSDKQNTALFAVYDGHGQGGELVAQFSLYHIQKKLRCHPNFNDDLKRAFRETFLAIDEALKDEPSIEPLYAGSTACVALLRDNVITLSNVGDSRAVLARRNRKPHSEAGGVTDDELQSWTAIPLTDDHNPDRPDEQARILQYGGYVSPPPEPGLSARVWRDASCSQIGLAMSRSIGDYAVKSVGVIADPEVTTYTLTNDDDFMILASDGVWEFISSNEAVNLVGLHTSKGMSKACQILIEEAANKWHEEEGDYRDDITALVIDLKKIWETRE